MNKKIALLILLSLGCNSIFAQNTTKISLQKSEKWWGITSGVGENEPFSSESQVFDLSSDVYQGFSGSILVSSAGRYIYSKDDFKVEFLADGSLEITSNGDKIEAQKSGKTLREAYLSMAHKYLTDGKKSIESSLLENPTFVYVGGDGDEQTIVDNIAKLSQEGVKNSIIVMSQSWQQYNGALEFDYNRFPAPKEMISNLRNSGNSVYLWISPLVSADSPLYRTLKERDFLLIDPSTSRPKLVEWDGGVSAMYDLTNPNVIVYLASKLDDLKLKYGVDGFKFVDNVVESINSDKNLAKNRKAGEKAWSDLTLKYSNSTVDGGHNMQTSPSILKLQDRHQDWESIQIIIPRLITAGLLGYTSVGVGENIDYSESKNELLALRMMQLQAMMPQFSLPADIYQFSDEYRNASLAALKLNVKMRDYIESVIKESIETGAPTIRPMEYEFPRKGFHDCKDQFMLGSKYLVAPFLGEQQRRSVRLPNGYWIDDMGVTYHGPRVIEVIGSVDRVPYFEYIKSASLIKQLF